MSESAGRPDIADVVEDNREVFDLVADGDDEVAQMARNILNEAEQNDA